MKKRVLSLILSVLLCISMMTGILPTAVMAADTYNYTLVLRDGVAYKNTAGGEVVTIPGLTATGLTKWTFNNVNFTTSAATAILIDNTNANADITIEVLGNNTVQGGLSTGKTYGIQAESSHKLIFTGSGTMSVTAGNNIQVIGTKDRTSTGLVADGMEIDGPHISVTGGSGRISYGVRLGMQNLILKNGSLTANASNVNSVNDKAGKSTGLYINFGEVNLEGGSLTAIGGTAQGVGASSYGIGGYAIIKVGKELGESNVILTAKGGEASTYSSGVSARSFFVHDGVTVISGKHQACDVVPNTKFNLGVTVSTNADGSAATYLEDWVGDGSDSYTQYCYMVIARTPTTTAGDAQRITTTEATVKFTSSLQGSYYYAVVDKDAAAPTVDTTGTGTPCDTTEQTVSLTGLSKGAKDVYIVAKSSYGMLSTPRKITVPAMKYQITVQSSDSAGGTVSGGGTYDEDKRITIGAYANAGYHFVEWQDENSAYIGNAPIYGFDVTGDATYIAVFASNDPTKYTVNIENDGNGTAYADKTEAAQGDTVTLTAQANDGYIFKDWAVTPGWISITNNQFTMPTEAVKVEAIFEQLTYTVTWVDENGTTVLETDDNVPYGTMPTYDGTQPTKTGNAQYSYTFSGWDKQLSAVTGDITYKATYTQSINKYTVTWYDEDGTSIIKQDKNLPYGTSIAYVGGTPTKDETAEYTYTFAAWTPTPSGTVTGNVSYTATYSQSVRQYEVILPSGTGYTVTPEQGSTSPVNYDGSYSFTVAVANGYDGSNMTVAANGIVLTADPNGVYTVSNIAADQVITVDGVVAQNPTVPNPPSPPVEIVYRNDNFETATGEFGDIAYYGRAVREGDIVTLKVALSEQGKGFGLDFTKITVEYEVEGAVQLTGNYLYTGDPVYVDGVATDFKLGKGFNKIVAHLYYNGHEAGTCEPFYAWVSE